MNKAIFDLQMRVETLETSIAEALIGKKYRRLSQEMRQAFLTLNRGEIYRLEVDSSGVIVRGKNNPNSSVARAFKRDAERQAALFEKKWGKLTTEELRTVASLWLKAREHIKRVTGGPVIAEHVSANIRDLESYLEWREQHGPKSEGR
jgi:hypothetical protein